MVNLIRNTIMFNRDSPTEVGKQQAQSDKEPATIWADLAVQAEN
jgi:hypothetical protein